MEAVLAIVGVVIFVCVFFILRAYEETRQKKARAERDRQREEDRDWARGLEARRVEVVNGPFAPEATPVAVPEPEAAL